MQKAAARLHVASGLVRREDGAVHQLHTLSATIRKRTCVPLALHVVEDGARLTRDLVQATAARVDFTNRRRDVQVAIHGRAVALGYAAAEIFFPAHPQRGVGRGLRRVRLARRDGVARRRSGLRVLASANATRRAAAIRRGRWWRHAAAWAWRPKFGTRTHALAADVGQRRVCPPEADAVEPCRNGHRLGHPLGEGRVVAVEYLPQRAQEFAARGIRPAACVVVARVGSERRAVGRGAAGIDAASWLRRNGFCRGCDDENKNKQKRKIIHDFFLFTLSSP